jgi:HK97 gp10 family phage protein
MTTGFKTLEVMAQVRRIKAQLEGVAAKCERPVIDALITQAALVASEIKALAPIDQTSKTLKDSVRVEEGKSTGKRAYVVKIKAGDTVTNAGGYNYARAVEFGTQKSPAHPFFFPIWRARRKGVRQVIRKAIKLAVRDVFK